MQFLGLILSSVVIEGIVSYIRLIRSDGKWQWKIICPIALGIIVAGVYNINIFTLFGLTPKIPLVEWIEPTIPYVGVVLTGILLSRGSNYIYDTINSVMKFARKAQASIESTANEE